MQNHAEIAPVMARALEGGNASIPGIVEDVLAHRNLWSMSEHPTPEMLDLLGKLD